MPSTGRRASRAQALRARDRGLRRVSVATRSLVAVSVGAVGFFSAVAARSQPGHAKAVLAGSGSAPAVALTPNTQFTPAPQFQGRHSDDSPNLAPPPTQPAPGYQYDPAPVVSGAT
jgi:hypothetical protein